jgi:hypothetical protein
MLRRTRIHLDGVPPAHRTARSSAHTSRQPNYGQDAEEALQEVTKRLGEANLSFKFHLLTGEAADMGS